MKSQPRTGEVIVPVRKHKQVKAIRQHPSVRLSLRTGERKIYASSRVFAFSMHVDSTIADTGMMRIGENIHAICPPYATVAPILLKLVHDNLAHRGTTPSNGAADADGR
jgi:hypothetical protein